MHFEQGGGGPSLHFLDRRGVGGVGIYERFWDIYIKAPRGQSRCDRLLHRGNIRNDRANPLNALIRLSESVCDDAFLPAGIGLLEMLQSFCRCRVAIKGFTQLAVAFAFLTSLKLLIAL